MPSHELLDREHSDCREIDLVLSCAAQAWEEATQTRRVDALDQAIQHAQDVVFKMALLKHHIVSKPILNPAATMG